MSVTRRLLSVAGWIGAVVALWWVTGWMGAGVHARTPHSIDIDARATGTIEGRVILPDPAPRRTAGRYSMERPSHPIQSIPAVAFVRGPVGGVGAGEAPSDLTMTQRDTAFVPSLLVVPVGTEVAFPNGDDLFHNVFSYSPNARFDLGRYPKGESKSVVLDEPGVVRVYCEVHDFMRAAVVVVENPFHALIDEEGMFRIPGVPPGVHTLVIWHPDRGQEEVTVEVPDGRTARIEVDLR